MLPDYLNQKRKCIQTELEGLDEMSKENLRFRWMNATLENYTEFVWHAQGSSLQIYPSLNEV